MTRLNKDYRSVDDGTVIVADDASEIQPAIDEISEDVSDGNISGGVVQLKAKAYYPETTIWLKRGVTLRGARQTHRQSTDTADSTEHQQTTIYTSGLNEGAEEYTWVHFNEKPDREDFDHNHGSWGHEDYKEKTHPHFPVIAGFDRMPVERDRERTDYERRHRAHGVGLEGLLIRADDDRWWDWEEHGPSDYWDEEKHATYFGVYDGFIFEGLTDIHVQNVEVSGFKGYGAFYKDTRRIVSRGNFYNGGYTDYHGSALTLDFDALGSQARYVKGVWDVHVRGPTPTVKLNGHGVRTQFVSGAWSRAKINGTNPRFIGTEEDFDNDEHLISPGPDLKNTTVFQPDSHTLIDGYQIEGNGQPGSEIVRASDSSMRLVNCHIRKADTGIGFVNQREVVGHNLLIATEKVGIDCKNFQGNWSNITINRADDGIRFGGRASPEGGFHHIYFSSGITNAIAGRTSQTATFTAPCFNGAENAFERPGEWDLNVICPIGHKNGAMYADAVTGDGATTSFDLSHRMDEIPQHVVATPQNGVARSHWPVSWTADEENVTFTFDDAIPDGETAEFSWTAYGWSHPMNNYQRR